MPQISLNDPIDGAELKQIILQRIKEALDRDCTLANDIAYAGFRLNYQINLKYLQSKVEGTLVWGDMMEGVESLDQSTETIIDHYASSSPNAAREDHDLPIPVMIQTPNGPERRKIHVHATKPKGKAPLAATTASGPVDGK